VAKGESSQTSGIPGRPLTRLGVFSALILSVGLFAALSLTVGVLSWLAIGAPELPNRRLLTVDDIVGIGSLSLGTAAAIGATVALVVAYRKQRDTEDRRETLVFQAAVQDLGDASLFKRMNGVYALRDLAEQWEGWRQRCIDMLCLTLTQSQGDSADDRVVAAEITALFRAKWTDSSNSWHDCNLTISNCTVGFMDLRGLHMSASLEIERVVIPPEGELLLDGLKLDGKGELRVQHMVVSGSVHTPGITCTSRAKILLRDVILAAKGEMTIKTGLIEAGGVLELHRMRLSEEGRFDATALRVAGKLVVGEVIATGRAKFVMLDSRYMGGKCIFGSISFHHESRFNMVGARLTDGAAIHIDEMFVSSVADLDSLRLLGKSSLIMRNVHLSGAGLVSLRGIYNKKGSRCVLLTTMEERSLVDLRGFENEDDHSVFVVHARMNGEDAIMRFSGGGNYGGHTHIVIDGIGKFARGRVQISEVVLSSGQVELDVDNKIVVDVHPKNWVLRFDPACEVYVPDQLRARLKEGGLCEGAVFQPSASNCWHDEVEQYATGDKIRSVPFGREFTWEEREEALSGGPDYPGDTD